MVIEMIEQKLISSPNKFKRGFILDNFPNSMKQVNLFNEFIRKHHLQINTVFHTCVSREVSFKRRNAEKRGYWDSSEKRERLFQANLVPVLLHFKKKKLLRTLYTEKPIKESVIKIKKEHAKLARIRRIKSRRLF